MKCLELTTFTGSADRTLVANFTPALPTISVERLIVLSPVIGKFPTFGAVKLSAPAPRGGIKVQLSSSNPDVLDTPEFVFVPAGHSIGIFAAETSRVKAITTVVVTARLGDSEQSFTVKVLPQKH